MGNHLTHPVCHKKSNESHVFPPVLQYASSCMQGYRTTMEDTILQPIKLQSPHSDKSYFVAGVFDGHGHESFSKECANQMSHEIQKTLHKFPNDMITAITTAYDQVDIEFSKREDMQQGGSTGLIVVGEIDMDHKCTLYIANAGDCRCLIGNRYSLTVEQLTQDHTPDLAAEYERISKSDWNIVNHRIDGNLQPSRGFGDYLYKRQSKEKSAVICNPEINIMNIDPKEDTFVLFLSDGITGELDNEQIHRYVQTKLYQNKRSLKEIVEELCELCGGEKSKTKDNTSVMLLYFHAINDKKTIESEEKLLC